MVLALVIPPLLSAALGVCGVGLGRAIRPSLTVRLLPIAGVLLALSTGFSLAVVALFLLARAAEIASLGHWSVGALPSPGHLPWQVGVPIAGLVAALLLAAAVHTTRVGRRLWIADELCRHLPPTLDDRRTVVIDDAKPDAYAVAGLRGRIVVSTGMLAALSEPQRQVLLAHEASHLAHRHHLWIQLAEISAVANPLLRTLPGVVRLAAERWADEDAAAAVGDRRITADAIARAALTSNAHRRAQAAGTTVLASTGGDVVHRVRALLDPPTHRWSAHLAATLVALIAATLASTVVTAHTTERRFEHAQASDTHLASAQIR